MLTSPGLGGGLHVDRGEGANHAILDVLDFAEKVTPALTAAAGSEAKLRAALDEYEDVVVRRTRPAVLASRRACLDAHCFANINRGSPLLSKRTPFLEFDEE